MIKKTLMLLSINAIVTFSVSTESLLTENTEEALLGYLFFIVKGVNTVTGIISNPVIIDKLLHTQYNY